MSVSSRDTAIVIETLNVPQSNPRLCLFAALPEKVTQNLKPSKSGAPVEIPANVNDVKQKDPAGVSKGDMASPLSEQTSINTGSASANHTHLFKHYINAQTVLQNSLKNHQVLEKLFTGDLKDVHNTDANTGVSQPYISTANRPLPVCISATHGLGETIGDAFWFSNYGSTPTFNDLDDLKTIFKQISRTWNMFSGGVYTKYVTDNGRRPEHSTDMDKTRAFTQKAFTSSPDTSPETFTPELAGVFSFAPTLTDFPVFCFSAPSEHAVYATLLSSTATTIQSGSTRYTAALNGHC